MPSHDAASFFMTFLLSLTRLGVCFFVSALILTIQFRLLVSMGREEQTSDGELIPRVVIVDDVKDEWIANLDRSYCRCGNFKCFIRSNTTPDIGWIVAEDLPFYPLKKDNNSTVGRAIFKAWNLTIALQDTYGIRHFGLESPEVMEDFQVHQRSAMQGVIGKCSAPSRKLYRKFVLRRLIVQKVQMAPTLQIHWHYVNKELRTNKREESSINNTCNVLRTFATHGDDFDAKEFSTTLMKERDATFRAISEHPSILMDFQVILDSKGHIYHYDLDRIFQYRSAQIETYLNRNHQKILKLFKGDIWRTVQATGSSSAVCK